MADYVANSACNGCKPKHLRGRSHYQRTGLLSLMIQKRDAARFLIAPSGFGKTALALEYAESIFGFRDVFWLNAKSPCFLRDVDSGTLVSSLFAQSRARSLVVMEDLPRLTAARADSVSACIDKLLERGWEVVVTMVPLHRSFADRQPDGVRICSRDFIVTEDEMHAIVCETGIGPRRPVSFSPTDGIPGLVWEGSNASLDLLRGIADEMLPTDLMLGLFVMLVLGQGSIEDAEVFTGPLKSDTRTMLVEDYLFLGVDEHRERFETYPFRIDEVVGAFAGSLVRMGSGSPFSDSSALTVRLADALLARGDCERACALVDGCCSADKRIEWLAGRTGELDDAGCLLPPHRLFTSRSMRLNGQTAAVYVAEAWRLAGLDDVNSALGIAERVLSRSSAPDEVRGYAALLMARYGDAAGQRRAIAALKRLAGNSHANDASRRFEPALETLRTATEAGDALVSAACWLSEEGSAAVALGEACLGGGETGRVQTGVMLLILDALKGKVPAPVDRPGEAVAGRVLSIVGDYLRRCEERGSFGFREATLLDAWDEAKSLASPDAPYPPLSAARATAQMYGMQLFSQRSAFEREQQAESPQPAKTTHAAHPSRGSAVRGMANCLVTERGEIVPTLHIRLFGGLDASIGGAGIDPTMFRRQKVKTLLAILTLNQGKEILRERLAEILWPTSSSTTAQRNFYSTWSLLRKALTVPGSELCPYLIRLQYSCKIDTRAVTSDVAEFDDLCNRLLIGTPDIEAWSGVYTRLNELYRGDLLPSEGRNEFILRQREEYRARLVDALVAAAVRLFERGELQSALWFAHAAVRRDSTREDAYTALMQAQIAAGQRTAALDTYFKCKRYLSDELGIDPSPQAVTLYGSIIEAEPNLKGFTPKA